VLGDHREVEGQRSTPSALDTHRLLTLAHDSTPVPNLDAALTILSERNSRKSGHRFKMRSSCRSHSPGPDNAKDGIDVSYYREGVVIVSHKSKTNIALGTQLYFVSSCLEEWLSPSRPIEPHFDTPIRPSCSTTIPRNFSGVRRICFDRYTSALLRPPHIEHSSVTEVVD
jgi:hypothetical protein